MRKFNTLLFAVIFILSGMLSGCKETTVLTWKDTCFEAIAVATAGEDFQGINDFAFNGETFIISAYSYEYPDNKDDKSDDAYENYNYITHGFLIAANEKDGIIKKVELPVSTGEENYSNLSYSYLYAEKNGTVYAIENEAQYSYNDSGSLVSFRTISVVTIDEDLNVERVLNLGAALADFIPDLNLSNTYFTDFKVDGKGNVYILVDGTAYGINIASGTVFMAKKDGETSGTITGFVQSPDNKMNILIRELTATTESSSFDSIMYAIDTEDGSFGEPVPFAAQDKTFPGGKKYPYYTYNSSYIYGVNPKTDEQAVVASLLESGSAALEIRDIVYADDDRFAVLAADIGTHIPGIYMLKKLAPKDVPDKKIVNVTALSTDYMADYYIKEFNRRSTEYKAELKTYAIEGISTADQMTAFNADFAAGNTPDVLIINQNMDYHGYVLKGMFADLYPLIDEDPDIARDDLVQPVLKAHETDGKLFSISPNYSISTLVGKTEIFGERAGQSLAELQAAAAVYPEASLFGDTQSASDIVTGFVRRSLSEYVNYSTGECYFDSPEFVALLEAAKEYPVEADISRYNFMDNKRAYANDRTLLLDYFVSDFRDVIKYEEEYFHAPVTFLGNPTKGGGTGAFVFPYDEVAILADSKNPDGAWAFVKGFMQYKGPADTQTSSSTKFFSIWQKNMDEFAADAMNDPYYIDYQTSERVYRKHVAVDNGELIDLPNNTVRDNAKITKLIDSVTYVYHNDKNILDIIAEDTDAYFKGQKNIDETIAMIQNRVSTYLAETR